MILKAGVNEKQYAKNIRDLRELRNNKKDWDTRLDKIPEYLQQPQQVLLERMKYLKPNVYKSRESSPASKVNRNRQQEYFKAPPQIVQKTLKNI